MEIFNLQIRIVGCIVYCWLLDFKYQFRRNKKKIFHFTFSSTRSGIGIYIFKETSNEKQAPVERGKSIIFVELMIDRSQERNKMKEKKKKKEKEERGRGRK